MAKSIEEQKEEARKHRMDLFGPCFGVFFLLTYGSIIAPYQEAMKRALKNKDGQTQTCNGQTTSPSFTPASSALAKCTNMTIR